jgi:hypothetical protein
MSQPSEEAKVLLALQALQNNPKLSTRRAVKIYQVGRMKLHRRQHNVQSRCDSMPNSRKLTDQEEDVIVQFILDLDSRGFPSRLRFIEEMANSLLADRNAPPVSTR